MRILSPPRRRSSRSWLLAALLCAVPLAAQAQPSKLSSPEKTFQRFTMPNGLEVIMIQNHFVPLVTIEIAVRNGSFTEGPEYSGLSHLYEHMFFKANEKYPTVAAFQSRMNALGILYNATTREEVVYYYFYLPSKNLAEGMELMSDAIQKPKFLEDELEKEREVVIGEFDRHESSPLFAFGQAVDVATWGDLITRKEPIGQRPVILSATPEKMRYIQKKYYIPNNSALFVAGDIDSAAVAKLANKYFTSWKRGADPFKTNPPPMAAPLAQKKLVTVPSPVDYAVVQYQWHGPSVGIDNKSTYAADVFIYILNQRQSRFQRQLVESGLCQGASNGYYTQRYVGPISYSVTTTPENIEKARRALWNEIQAFDSPDYFTDEELETSKTHLRMESLYDSEETSEWVSTPAFWWSTTGLDYYIGYIDNLAKVTREDIQAYIRKYVKGKNYVLGITTNEAALSAAKINPKEVLQ